MTRARFNVGRITCTVFSMIKDRSIQIKNIYYMLTYAFQVLKQTNYEEISSENFDNIGDLFAAILAKGLAQQLKQGLYREYITINEDLSTLRGKVDITSSIKLKMQRKPMIACEHDELSENNRFNQIIKTTANMLIRQPSVSSEHKAELKKEMLFFSDVDEIEIGTIRWDMLKYQRNNQGYKMLINVCYFVLEGLIHSDEKGDFKMASFLDEQRMCRLYERFILEYYRYHYKGVISANSTQVKWNVDDGAVDFLPIMQTDIMLKCKGKTLIIDAKYYAHTMQTGQYNTQTLHSNNMYQIFTYVKNQDVMGDGSVSGMLLYAKTDETITPNNQFMMNGNKISVRTLDLNLMFSDISVQLDRIAKEHFDL